VVLHQKDWSILLGVHLPKMGVVFTETGCARTGYLSLGYFTFKHGRLVRGKWQQLSRMDRLGWASSLKDYCFDDRSSPRLRRLLSLFEGETKRLSSWLRSTPLWITGLSPDSFRHRVCDNTRNEKQDWERG
jgi:hypothetical protein